MPYSPTTLKAQLKEVAPLRSHLSLHFGVSTARYCIHEVDGGSGRWYGDLNSDIGYSPGLKLLTEMPHDYRSVSMSYLTDKRTLIADGLCDESNMDTYLKAVCTLDRGSVVCADTLSSIGCRLVYAMPQKLMDEVHVHFPTCRL